MHSQKTFNDCCDGLSAAYEKTNPNHLVKANAIPWVSIIEIIIQLLGGCFPKADSGGSVKARLATLTDDDSRWLGFNVRRALIREAGAGAWRKLNGPGVTAAVVQAGKDAKESLLDEVVNESLDWDI